MKHHYVLDSLPFNSKTEREIVCFIGCLLDWSLPFLQFLCLLPPFSGRGATQVIPIDFHYTVVSSPGVNKLGHIDGT